MKHVKGILQHDRTKAMGSTVAYFVGILAAVVIPLTPML